MKVSKWRYRAGRGIGSDYTAMERSTSQSGGRSKFDAKASNSCLAGLSRLSDWHVLPYVAIIFDVGRITPNGGANHLPSWCFE
jgi:hypothetical protein